MMIFGTDLAMGHLQQQSDQPKQQKPPNEDGRNGIIPFSFWRVKQKLPRSCTAILQNAAGNAADSSCRKKRHKQKIVQISQYRDEIRDQVNGGKSINAGDDAEQPCIPRSVFVSDCEPDGIQLGFCFSQLFCNKILYFRHRGTFAGGTAPGQLVKQFILFSLYRRTGYSSSAGNVNFRRAAASCPGCWELRLTSGVRRGIMCMIGCGACRTGRGSAVLSGAGKACRGGSAVEKILLFCLRKQLLPDPAGALETGMAKRCFDGKGTPGSCVRHAVHLESARDRAVRQMWIAGTLGWTGNPI